MFGVAGVRVRAAPWTPAWDRAVLAAALAKLDERYDPAERLLRTAVRAGRGGARRVAEAVRHPVAGSVRYALYLLESGEPQRQRRAAEILDRLLGLQDTEPKSPTYGLWAPVLEQRPGRRAPQDRGRGIRAAATLAEIGLRHGRAFPGGLRGRVDRAVELAATELAWRGLRGGSMGAEAAGSFLALAAGEMFEDRKLVEHGAGELLRLASRIDQTGSFEDYGSPQRMRRIIGDLTRIRMHVKDETSRAMARKIHDRAWLHLARRWHPPTRQVAGPISHCRRADIGAPLWLQKALGGVVEFASLEEIRAGRVEPDGEAALLDWRCPAELRRQFLELAEPALRRETFRPAMPPAPPVQGTTLLEREFCLGSVNLGGFGRFERPLLAFWGGPERPARYVRLRVMADGRDLGAAVFTSVQERNCVLGFVNFGTGAAEQLRCRRIRVRLDLAGVETPVRMLVGGKKAEVPVSGLHPGTRLAMDLGGIYLWVRFPRAVFGDGDPRLSVEWEDGLLAVSLDLLRSGTPKTVRWADLREAWAALNLVVEEAQAALYDFNLKCSLGRCRFEPRQETMRAVWRSPAGRLWMDGGRAPAPASQQYGRYRAGIRSGPVEYVRLSEEPLAGGVKATP